MTRAVKRVKIRATVDEQRFMQVVPLPPKTNRWFNEPPNSQNRMHLIDVAETVGDPRTGKIRAYDYILHATKGWRRRRKYGPDALDIKAYF